MKSIHAIIEFMALLVIGMVVLSFFENGMANTAAVQASANRQNALTSLLYQGGEGGLSLLGWNNPSLKYAP